MLKRINWDALGVSTSLACAIHCAVLPLAMSSLPVLGINIIENQAFEYFMIGLAFAIGCYALTHSFKRHHHNFFPLVIFSVGVLFLVLKQVFHAFHLWLLVPAVTLIVAAHGVNFQLCRRANHCHADDCSH